MFSGGINPSVKLQERKNMGRRIQTTSLSAKIAYLVGIENTTLDEYYGDQNELILKLLRENKEATIIRYLCRIRTAFIRHYKEIDTAIRYDMKNITTLPEYIDASEVNQLEKWGISIIRTNYRADRYLCDVQTLIRDNIDNCKDLFGEWLKWEFIRDFFITPKGNKPETNKIESAKYKSNYLNYPYQQYFYWKNPKESGYIFINDEKFLKFLYSMHGEQFNDEDKFLDAAGDVKDRIHAFIDKSEKSAFAIDCENSNVYKIYSMLKGLNEENLSKISKITLYDDENTTNGWDYLKNFISIPVEHIEVERVVNYKSLVDIKMSMGVSKDFYADGITSFILCSSDSDFWALISSLPQASFLVMYEEEKCGAAIKTALSINGTYYCALDDFNNGSGEELKRVVLNTELDKQLPYILGRKPSEVAEETYKNAKIDPTIAEKNKFIEKTVKTLQLVLNENDEFEIRRKN